MITSRSKGLLVIKTDKPYKIAVDGKIVESNILHCLEPAGELGDDVAYQLIHYLQAVIFSISTNDRIKKSAEVDDEEIKDNLYYDKENPTDDEVNEAGLSLSISLSFQSGAVKLNEFMRTFDLIVEYGFLKSSHEQTITIPVWRTLTRDDRQSIAFKYCGFFLNPFEKLYRLGKSKGNTFSKSQIIDKEPQ